MVVTRSATTCANSFKLIEHGITAIGPKQCVFCTLSPSRVIDENTTAILIRDGFPVSPGHTLVIPKRHTGSFFDMSDKERSDLLALLDSAKLALDNEFQPQGYNIGINDGPAAGQTVPHLHVHLIPRFDEDVPDPRGGVRWVIPHKAKYWP
ncbi:MAG: HIT family protein [Rhodoferax sp.]|nr:HIT family protein [Rhodoferax sp.]